MIAPGHNPAQLTVEQVGAGYRLLDWDEILSGINHDVRSFHEGSDVMDAWCHGFWDRGEWYGSDLRLSYRTKLTRAEVRAVRHMPAEHNPQSVPASTLPEGYRFLDVTEIREGGERIHLGEWDRFTHGKWNFGHLFGSYGTSTYCTDMSREMLAAARGLAPLEARPAPIKPRHPELRTRYGDE